MRAVVPQFPRIRKNERMGKIWNEEYAYLSSHPD